MADRLVELLLVKGASDLGKYNCSSIIFESGLFNQPGYLNPKSCSPASILGSPAIYSKKAKRFFFPLFKLVMVLMLFFFYFVGCMLKGCYIFLFLATIL